MTLDHTQSPQQVATPREPYSAATVAAWWIGAFAAAIAILAIVIALAKPTATTTPPAETVAPPEVTVARSAPVIRAPAKPEAELKAENEMRQASNQGKKDFDSLVFPPPAIPPSQ